MSRGHTNGRPRQARRLGRNDLPAVGELPSGDRGCCANDPPSAAVAVLEDRTARTASESSRPSQAAITQIQWPIHQAMSSRPSLRNSGRRVRWARNFVRRITTKAAIAPAYRNRLRHLQCLSVRRLRQAGQSLDPQAIARANPVDSDTHPAAARMGPATSPAFLPELNHKLSLQARREE